MVISLNTSNVLMCAPKDAIHNFLYQLFCKTIFKALLHLKTRICRKAGSAPEGSFCWAYFPLASRPLTLFLVKPKNITYFLTWGENAVWA